MNDDGCSVYIASTFRALQKTHPRICLAPAPAAVVYSDATVASSLALQHKRPQRRWRRRTSWRRSRFSVTAVLFLAGSRPSRTSPPDVRLWHQQQGPAPGRNQSFTYTIALRVDISRFECLASSGHTWLQYTLNQLSNVFNFLDSCVEIHIEQLKTEQAE